MGIILMMLVMQSIANDETMVHTSHISRLDHSVDQDPIQLDKSYLISFHHEY